MVVAVCHWGRAGLVGTRKCAMVAPYNVDGLMTV